MRCSAPVRLGVFAVLAGLGAAGGISLVAPASSASDASGWRPAAESDPAALQLLRKAAGAGNATAYAGVQYLTSWGPDGGSTSVVVEIRHVPGDGSTVQVRATPGTGAIRVYEADSSEASHALGGQALALLQRKYDVALAAPDSVAGRPADVVEVHRPDGSLAARLWLDAGTGLLLRREVIDRRGRMTRASAFVELRVGRGLPPMTGEAVSQPAPRPWDRKLQAADLSRLRDRGWAVPAKLAGGLDLYDARSRDSDGEQVVHLSFSDGLSTVSLFEQRGRLDTRQLGGWRRQKIGGARVYLRDTVPRQMMWASRGKVYTVLADAPEDTVAAAISRLPHSAPATGLLHRMGRGLCRVGSWFNPFA